MDKVKRIDFLGTLFATGVIVCLLLALAWGISFGYCLIHVRKKDWLKHHLLTDGGMVIQLAPLLPLVYLLLY